MNISCSALQALTRKTLEGENRRYTGRGGVSEENQGLGFLPAYRDSATGSIHLSRLADGRRAPIHLLDGLPEPLVLERDTSGKVVALKGSVSAGFVREGRFYTREQAARAMMREARDGNSPSSAKPVQASLSPYRRVDTHRGVGGAECARDEGTERLRLSHSERWFIKVDHSHADPMSHGPPPVNHRPKPAFSASEERGPDAQLSIQNQNCVPEVGKTP